MNWYTVEEEFLTYLRNYENRIPKIDYGEDRLKPFFGSLFEINDLIYLTQVSHPKRRHRNMREDFDFIKLYNGQRLIAVVNLNYMFPVHKSKLIEVKYKNIENFRNFKNREVKGNYIALLKKEMKQIKSKGINDKALKLYNMKYEYPDNRVSLRCLDFKEIEKKCLEYVRAIK